MSMTYDVARQMLEKHNQSHLLRFWEQLDAEQRSALLAQIEGLDFDSIGRMQKMLVEKKHASAKSDIHPAPVVSLSGADRTNAEKTGEEALRSGEVGVLLVAGGQGSRLGYDGPKGCFKIGPVSGATLFEIHARKILALERKYATKVPFYIMTSTENDGPTKSFFDANNFFGLSRDSVKFFTQGMWPALDPDGKIILDSAGHIFASPDGHGGILTALKVNGMLADMEERRLTTLFYFQVDNPLVEIADPAFIGVHKQRKADISVKVCAKRNAAEPIGVVVEQQGRCSIVEYSELTESQKNEKGADGRLKFLFGSVAIHIFSLDFLKKEASVHLPLHIAHKKVAYCDGNGKTIKPTAPNAYKFEKFIFDTLPDAERSVNMEFLRQDEFSPVKNATGDDSPEITQRDMMLKFARWFVDCGVKVPTDASGKPLHRIEIDPCYALNAADLRQKLPRDFKLKGDILLK